MSKHLMKDACTSKVVPYKYSDMGMYSSAQKCDFNYVCANKITCIINIIFSIIIIIIIYPFCPCLLLNLSPISGCLVCRSKILMRKASSALEDIITFSTWDGSKPLYLKRKEKQFCKFCKFYTILYKLWKVMKSCIICHHKNSPGYDQDLNACINSLLSIIWATGNIPLVQVLNFKMIDWIM